MAMALSALPVQEEPHEPGEQLTNQLASAVRSINWSYAIFWSISSTHQGVLAWKDGYYNGDVKTRKITNSSSEMTAAQLVLQRSQQLRELYESLQLSGERGGRAMPRPVASLSPEDLGDAEWYYVVCMTYAFRPGQGLPGKSLATNENVWLRNAHLADTNTFPRAILAKSASVQTIVCIPLMGGVLELGTTASVLEDPDLVSRATMQFRELQFPAFTWTEPSSSPTANEAADAAVFEDITYHAAAMEAVIAEGQELGEGGCLSHADLEQIAKEIDGFYSVSCEEPDVLPLLDDWIMDDGLLELEVPSSAEAAGSRVTSFTAWMRPEHGEAAAVPATGRPQELLKKVLAGGAWAANNGGGSTTGTATQESGIKNHHVMSERRRRAKLNEMFLILKSLVPSINKADKASILAETIAYLKELQQRVQELECSRDRTISRHGDEIAGTSSAVPRGRRGRSLAMILLENYTLLPVRNLC